MKNEDLSSSSFYEFCTFLSEVRRYFWGRDFLETPTPSLVTCPGMEAHLDPMKVELENGTFYLPTSPEIHLKKRLCQGFHRIFEVRPCFRQDPLTSLHRPEFFMLEWYRAHGSLDDLILDIRGLLEHLRESGHWKASTQITKISFRQLFQEQLGFALAPDTSKEELKVLMTDLKVHWHASDSKVDLIHRLLMEKLEPSFQGLVILEEFPSEMAILSQIGSSGFAQRFELYFHQIELANAFFEVTDPEVQKQRWKQDLEERKTLGKVLLPMDEELLDLMKSPGLPESSGIALGLDRLFMVGRGSSQLISWGGM